jgi:hypothetical protein
VIDLPSLTPWRRGNDWGLQFHPLIVVKIDGESGQLCSSFKLRLDCKFCETRCKFVVGQSCLNQIAFKAIVARGAINKRK